MGQLSNHSKLTFPPGSRSQAPAQKRLAAIALCVVVLHVGFIYVLYQGLLTRTVELIVPVVMLSQLIEPPQPVVVKPAPAPPTPPTPPTPQAPPTPVKAKQAVVKAPVPAAPAPLPVAINDPTPAPNAPTGAVKAQPAAVATTTPASPVAATAPAAAAPSAAPAVQMPSSSADYLQNPTYPAISRRLNEQGKTIVRVLIGADGLPQRAEVATSSGFSRLDEAAVATVMRWRYVPGKRAGVAEAMWFNVPLNWVLE